MEHPEERYYRLNRFFLSVTGLWPYQSKWSARFIRTVITIVMLLCIFAQFKELFEHMWNDWALEKTDEEIKIMHQYAETSRLFIIYHALLLYMIIMVYIIWLFMPEIFDIILPLNESRQRMQSIHVEFYIDKERYLYFILSCTCIVIFLVPLVFLASSSLYLVLTQHVCGMCELLGYRAERLFYVTEDMTERNLIHRTKISCKNIAVLVRLHYNIIQYNSAWYNANVSQQKSLLLIMKRRFHPLVLTACKFYPMSLSSFEMILQMGISYSMFIRQV
ncbi:uncharacterized protein [Anoplolepis gracilipes]|uniref:uncharacterized protein isoform X2 n=1 Tax=Anoplolepis gracilipes TaxID=354296 RepID=UPI003B9EF19C